MAGVGVEELNSRNVMGHRLWPRAFGPMKVLSTYILARTRKLEGKPLVLVWGWN
jgi:hypothetical protein